METRPGEWNTLKPATDLSEIFVTIRLKHSNLSTIPKKGRTKPSPLKAGEK